MQIFFRRSNARLASRKNVIDIHHAIFSDRPDPEYNYYNYLKEHWTIDSIGSGYRSLTVDLIMRPLEIKFFTNCSQLEPSSGSTFVDLIRPPAACGVCRSKNWQKLDVSSLTGETCYIRTCNTFLQFESLKHVSEEVWE